MEKILFDEYHHLKFTSKFDDATNIITELANNKGTIHLFGRTDTIIEFLSKKDKNKLLEILLANNKISELEYLCNINVIDICTAKKYLRLFTDELLSTIMKRLTNIENFELLSAYIEAINERSNMFIVTMAGVHNKIFFNMLKIAYLHRDIEMIENLSNDDNNKLIIASYDDISSFKWDMCAINFVCEHENVTLLDTLLKNKKIHTNYACRTLTFGEQAFNIHNYKLEDHPLFISVVKGNYQLVNLLTQKCDGVDDEYCDNTIVKTIHTMVHNFTRTFSDEDKKIFGFLIKKASQSILFYPILRKIIRDGKVDISEYYTLHEMMTCMDPGVLSFMVSSYNNHLYEQFHQHYRTTAPNSSLQLPCDYQIIDLCSQNGNLDMIKKITQKNVCFKMEVIRNHAFKIAYLSCRYNIIAYYLTLPSFNPYIKNIVTLFSYNAIEENCTHLPKELMVIIISVLVNELMKKLLS